MSRGVGDLPPGQAKKIERQEVSRSTSQPKSASQTSTSSSQVRPMSTSTSTTAQRPSRQGATSSTSTGASSGSSVTDNTRQASQTDTTTRTADSRTQNSTTAQQQPAPSVQDATGTPVDKFTPTTQDENSGIYNKDILRRGTTPQQSSQNTVGAFSVAAPPEPASTYTQPSSLTSNTTQAPAAQTLAADTTRQASQVQNTGQAIESRTDSTATPQQQAARAADTSSGTVQSFSVAAPPESATPFTSTSQVPSGPIPANNTDTAWDRYMDSRMETERSLDDYKKMPPGQLKKLLAMAEEDGEDSWLTVRYIQSKLSGVNSRSTEGRALESALNKLITESKDQKYDQNTVTGQGEVKGQSLSDKVLGLLGADRESVKAFAAASGHEVGGAPAGGSTTEAPAGKNANSLSFLSDMPSGKLLDMLGLEHNDSNNSAVLLLQKSIKGVDAGTVQGQQLETELNKIISSGGSGQGSASVLDMLTRAVGMSADSYGQQPSQVTAQSVQTQAEAPKTQAAPQPAQTQAETPKNQVTAQSIQPQTEAPASHTAAQPEAPASQVTAQSVQSQPEAPKSQPEAPKSQAVAQPAQVQAEMPASQVAAQPVQNQTEAPKAQAMPQAVQSQPEAPAAQAATGSSVAAPAEPATTTAVSSSSSISTSSATPFTSTSQVPSGPIPANNTDTAWDRYMDSRMETERSLDDYKKMPPGQLKKLLAMAEEDGEDSWLTVRYIQSKLSGVNSRSTEGRALESALNKLITESKDQKYNQNTVTGQGEVKGQSLSDKVLGLLGTDKESAKKIVQAMDAEAAQGKQTGSSSSGTGQGSNSVIDVLTKAVGMNADSKPQEQPKQAAAQSVQSQPVQNQPEAPRAQTAAPSSNILNTPVSAMQVGSNQVNAQNLSQPAQPSVVRPESQQTPPAMQTTQSPAAAKAPLTLNEIVQMPPSQLGKLLGVENTGENIREVQQFQKNLQTIQGTDSGRRAEVILNDVINNERNNTTGRNDTIIVADQLKKMTGNDNKPVLPPGLEKKLIAAQESVRPQSVTENKNIQQAGAFKEPVSEVINKDLSRQPLSSGSVFDVLSKAVGMNPDSRNQDQPRQVTAQSVQPQPEAPRSQAIPQPAQPKAEAPKNQAASSAPSSNMSNISSSPARAMQADPNQVKAYSTPQPAVVRPEPLQTPAAMQTTQSPVAARAPLALNEMVQMPPSQLGKLLRIENTGENIKQVEQFQKNLQAIQGTDSGKRAETILNNVINNEKNNMAGQDLNRQLSGAGRNDRASVADQLKRMTDHDNRPVMPPGLEKKIVAAQEAARPQSPEVVRPQSLVDDKYSQQLLNRDVSKQLSGAGKNDGMSVVDQLRKMTNQDNKPVLPPGIEKKITAAQDAIRYQPQVDEKALQQAKISRELGKEIIHIDEASAKNPDIKTASTKDMNLIKGQTAWGDIKQMDGDYYLRIGKNSMKITGDHNLAEGQKIQVAFTGNTQDNMSGFKILRTAAQAEVPQVVSKMNIPVDPKAANIARNLAEFKIPVTNQNINEIKNVLLNLDRPFNANDVSSASFLKKMNLPLTPENVKIMSEFIENKPMIGNELNSLSDLLAEHTGLEKITQNKANQTTSTIKQQNMQFNKLNSLAMNLKDAINSLVIDVKNQSRKEVIKNLQNIAKELGIEKIGQGIKGGGIERTRMLSTLDEIKKEIGRLPDEALSGETGETVKQILKRVDSISKNIQAHQLINSGKHEPENAFLHMQAPLRLTGEDATAKVRIGYSEDDEGSYIDSENTRIEFDVTTENLGDIRVDLRVFHGIVSMEIGGQDADLNAFINRYTPLLAQRLGNIGYITGNIKAGISGEFNRPNMIQKDDFDNMEEVNVQA